MSLVLYSPRINVTHGTKVEVVAKFLGINLEFNRIPPTEWKTPEHLKRHPLGKVPVLETPEGCIYESLSIIRYLARKAGKLYGTSAAETAQIDQWLEFSNTQLQPYLAAINYPINLRARSYKYFTSSHSWMKMVPLERSSPISTIIFTSCGHNFSRCWLWFIWGWFLAFVLSAVQIKSR